jgi:hypothetical protein
MSTGGRARDGFSLSPWSFGARRWLSATGSVLLVAGLVLGQTDTALAAGTIPLSGATYTQDFNGLSNVAGSTTNVVAILGWDVSEAGGGSRDNEQYAVDDGGALTGDTYSYGADGSTDRAFGGLQSGTLVPTIGASFTNATGAPITSIDVAYIGEQWRLGAVGRPDRLDFQISTNATSLATGTWIDVDALDFTAPTTGPAVGGLDGNAAANRTAVGSSIVGLAIPDGATFWIRWASVNAAGADDGLAVEDFSLTPHPDPAPAVSATDPGDGAVDVARDASLTIAFTEPVTVSGVCGSRSTARPAARTPQPSPAARRPSRSTPRPISPPASRAR